MIRVGFVRHDSRKKTPLKLAREKLKLKTWLDSGQHRSPFLELVLPDLKMPPVCGGTETIRWGGLFVFLGR